LGCAKHKNLKKLLKRGEKRTSRGDPIGPPGAKRKGGSEGETLVGRKVWAPRACEGDKIG